jgi:hypothetical protein
MPRPRRDAEGSAKSSKKTTSRPRTALPAATVIAARAYELFLQRGGVHGYDRDDWFAAERELGSDFPGAGTPS